VLNQLSNCFHSFSLDFFSFYWFVPGWDQCAWRQFHRGNGFGKAFTSRASDHSWYGSR